ncbi:hypothetical protein V8C37DRAFT_378424 [Trichoderma ceciliae]
MPNRGQRQRVSGARDRWREREKAVDESQKGQCEGEGKQQSSVGRRGRATPAKQAPSALWDLVAGSPVCPLSVRPLSTSIGWVALLLTTINHHHLALTPSNPGATLIHPRRAGIHPSDPCRDQALRWTPSSTPNRKSVRTRTKYRPRHALLLRNSFAPFGRQLSASLQACKQCAPNCGAGAVAEGTCRCWREEGSSIAAAFGPLRAKDGKISPLASKR